MPKDITICGIVRSTERRRIEHGRGCWGEGILLNIASSEGMARVEYPEVLTDVVGRGVIYHHVYRLATTKTECVESVVYEITANDGGPKLRLCHKLNWNYARTMPHSDGECE